MSEGLSLKWEDVHVDKQNPLKSYLVLKDTKNYRDHIIPCSSPVLDILNDRWKANIDKSKYLFPSPMNANKQMGNPRRHLDKLSEALNTKITNHTFRRTFASVADECGFNLTEIKRGLNHKSRDVTEGYIIPSVAHVTPLFQAVVERMLDIDNEHAEWNTIYDYEDRKKNDELKS